MKIGRKEMHDKLLNLKLFDGGAGAGAGAPGGEGTDSGLGEAVILLTPRRIRRTIQILKRYPG